jgi:uncharacterized repeat protein (TIGR01451 family)/flagellin-like protein
MKIKRVEKAVSEILGTILLLAIAVMFFTVLYFQVLSAPAPTPPIIANIAGKIEENCILLEHRGGETLGLDTEISITIDGSTINMTVGDYLDNKSKDDGVWGLGERMVYPIKIDVLDLNKKPQAEIVVVDRDSNSLVMVGTIGIEAVCDMSIEMTVDNSFPEIGTNIVFTLTLTNHGNINITGVEIEFILPDELTHYSNTTPHSTYKNSTGIWNNIGILNPEQSAVLTVIATVEELGFGEPTQLAMILDGSASIDSEDWNLSLNGLATAIQNKSTFPQDDRVELTIVQFGGKQPAYARNEIGPIVINEMNSATVADDIRNITQIGDKTPTSCGILLTADRLANSGFFSASKRQVILLVTSGNPTHCCVDDGDYQSDGCSGESGPKKSANDARNYLISKLGMTDDQDEFDAVAVGHSDPHAIWLKDNIAWPEPGYFAPPFQVDSFHQGWVCEISTWQEFVDSIDDIFGILFSQISISVQMPSTTITDPKLANNFDTVLLY